MNLRNRDRRIRRNCWLCGLGVFSVLRRDSVLKCTFRMEMSNSQRSAPDIVLFAVGRQPRTLLRAQLIEEGFDVLATDTWPEMRRLLRPAARPVLAIVDAQGAPDPDR